MKKTKINDLSFYLKKLEEQIKSKVSRRKNKDKSGNKWNRKWTNNGEKSVKQNWFFEKINNFYRLPEEKKRKDKLPVSGIKEETLVQTLKILKDGYIWTTLYW